MVAKVKIVGMRTRVTEPNARIINTCSNSYTSWQRDLSPFLIGPCQLYGNHISQNMENAWQYSKLYAKYADANGNPTKEYWQWAIAGFNNPMAVRYPMGRGAKPLYAWWDGEKVPYIEARKKIYAPLYAEAVQKTQGWKQLNSLFQTEELIVLRDFDGHDHDKLGLSLTEVLNNPKRKMGHAFVLKMLLTEDPALEQTEIKF